jgi:uncharacterized protein YkwD
MPSSLRHILATCVILAVTLLTTAPAIAATQAHAHRHHPSLLTTLCGRMLQLLNKDRAAGGVGPLTLNSLLSRVASGHSRDMALHHYFAHDGRDGTDPFTRMSRMGVHFDDAAENIGQTLSIAPFTALTTLNAEMMAEPLVAGTHHAIIMSPLYHHVGIGIFLDTRRGLYLTEDFTN